MSDTSGLTPRLLRDIQRELADMRDDRTVTVAILQRHDAGMDSISVELRALRSQFDRHRSDVRERLAAIDTKLDLLLARGDDSG